MTTYSVRAVSPDDGTAFLNWKTEARSAQYALRDFLKMLDETMGPDCQLMGDFDIEVREIREMVAVKSKWPRPV